MVDSARAASASSLPLGEFLDALRRHGFSVGLGHYARMVTLLDRLDQECQPEQLRTMLCPLFATNAEQQQRFYRVFDGWFPLFANPFDLPDVREEPVGSPVRVPARESRRWWRMAILVAAMILLAVSGFWVARARAPQRSTLPAAAPALPDVPRNEPAPAPVIPAEPASAQRTWRDLAAEPWVQGLAVGLILIGFGVGEWRSYRRRRVVLERQRRERPPLAWPIRAESNANPLAESGEFYTTARRLRERQTGDRSRLDIPATISATIGAVGFPTFRFVLETRPPEYLVLIEQVSARDHQARLHRQLVASLTAEGVHTSVYFFRDDPRVCEPADGGPAAMISELRRRHPSHRLLVLGDGDGLVDPISGRRRAWVGEALSWPDRALLTPEPIQTWGAREVAIASHLIVLPASLAGLQAAIDHFQTSTRAVMPRPAGKVRGTRDLDFGPYLPTLASVDQASLLRRRLGDRGLQWVCACAVYPELQWNLTLYLGMLPEIGGGTIDDATLLELVRLSWFRTGSIPDQARAELLRAIRPEVERAARGAVITLLERNPAPAETIASSRHELDLVVQKLALHGKDRARRRELLRAAQHIPRDRVVSELSVLRLTDLDPGSTLALRLPNRMRRLFFHGGLPMFGMTTAARSVVAMLFMAGVILAGRPSPWDAAEQLQAVVPDDTAFRPIVLSGAPDTLPTQTAAMSAESNAIADSAYAALTPLRLAVGARDLSAVKRHVRQLERRIETQLQLLFEQPLQHELRLTPRNTMVYGLRGDSMGVVAYWDTRTPGVPMTRLIITVTRDRDGRWVARRLSEVPRVPVVLSADPVIPLVGDTVKPRVTIRSLAGQDLTSGLEKAVQLTSRDSAVARVLPGGRIIGARAGSTFIVAKVLSSRFVGVDSGLVAVRRRPTAADLAEQQTYQEETGQRRTSAVLDSAIAHYEAFNVEAARPILLRLVRDPALSSANRAIALKYLGASYAVLAAPDTAVNYFIEAIKLNPFVDLDPAKFAASELDALMEARRVHFALGVRPVADVNPDSGVVFFVVTTQRAQLSVELIRQEDTRRAVMYSGGNDGLRTIRWNVVWPDGTSAARSDRPVTYELRATAVRTQADGRPAADTARQVFRVMPKP